MSEARVHSQLPRHVPDALYEMLRSTAHVINRAYWRVTVEGPSVPSTGGVILAPVHRSFIDFFVVAEATRRKLYFMTKEEMWKSRLLGRFLDSVGAFPVHRQGADRLSVERSQAVLERGEVLVIFPEGTRRSGEEIDDLQEGAAFLAGRSGATIVPVGIGGTSQSLPKGSRLPRPVKVHLVLGEPLRPPQRSSGGRIPRREVRELTEKLREELQRAYDLARARVNS